MPLLALELVLSYSAIAFRQMSTLSAMCAMPLAVPILYAVQVGSGASPEGLLG